MDSAVPTTGVFSINLNGTDLENSSFTQYQNYGMNWFFYGFVKAGTHIKLTCPSKQYHYCKWKACEFALES